MLSGHLTLLPPRARFVTVMVMVRIKSRRTRGLRWGCEFESGVAEMGVMRFRGSCGTCSSLAETFCLNPGHV